MFFNLVSDPTSSGTLFLPNYLYNQYPQLSNLSTINICVGCLSTAAKLELSLDLNENSLKISEDIFNELHLPVDLSYQIKVKENNIYIGPIIGLILAPSNSSLSKRQLKTYLIYTLLYSQFKGLMYIFSTEDIDFGSKTVKGLYFNPKMINESDAWKEGIFPLSNAIYRRVGLSTKEMSKLRQFTNNGLFNSRYFDKLEFWNLVHDKNLVNEHVPKTKFISSLNEVEDMFLEFNSLYLKPTDDSMAGGLIKVEKIKDCYYTKKPFDDNSAIFKSKDELNKFIQDIISTRKYLVQQSIKSLQIDNRPADFRVIMQKDNTLKWRCTGIICRIGKENGICSNFRSYGYAVTFEELFEKLKLLNQKEIFKKRQELVNVCMKFCKILDSTDDNYGDLGIDAIIDEDLKIWIIEINKRQDHRIPLSIKDEQMYLATKNTPIKYAVGLSGFEL